MLRLMHTGVLSAVLVVGLVAASPASVSAAFVTVPAVTFVPRGASAAGDVTLGLLANGGVAGTYYAAVSLPVGQNVCGLRFWARDNDGDGNVTARLVRKQLQAGDGVGFGPPPEVMASVGTTGADADTQRLDDLSIVNPMIVNTYTYWLEIEFEQGFLEALAVRISTAPTC
jgi:hypothetical protein